MTEQPKRVVVFSTDRRYAKNILETIGRMLDQSTPGAYITENRQVNGQESLTLSNGVTITVESIPSALRGQTIDLLLTDVADLSVEITAPILATGGRIVDIDPLRNEIGRLRTFNPEG